MRGGARALLIVAALAGGVELADAEAQTRARLPSEMRTVTDAVTHIPIVFLTTGSSNDAKIYPTHPQWTADGGAIVFRSSNRAGDNNPQIFAVRERDGAIRQLTMGSGVRLGSVNVARHSAQVFYLRQDVEHRLRLVALDIGLAFTSTEALPERTIATFQEGFRDSDGFSLDAEEAVAYIGVRLDAATSPQIAATQSVTGAIWAVDLTTGATREVITTPFRVGHVQANPWVSSEIMYCHETGGDAPQRMWAVLADGTGNRPLYAEAPGEWVTHETFIDRDHVIFNILGHREDLRRRPTGVAVLNLRTGHVQMQGQLDEGGGLWHSHATVDGQWAVADTFDGSLFLINRRSLEMTLLSTGHRMRPDHAHPTFSPDGSRVLVQSGLLTNGENLDIAIIRVPARLRRAAMRKGVQASCQGAKRWLDQEHASVDTSNTRICGGCGGDFRVRSWRRVGAKRDCTAHERVV